MEPGFGVVPARLARVRSCLGLPKAFIQFESGILIKTVVNFWIERFACGGGILKRAQIVAFHALFDKETVDGRRCTERGNTIFFDQLQKVMRNEFFVIIDKDSAAHHPLAIELSPDRLAPSSVGYSQVQPIGRDIMPVFGCDQMADSISIIVQDHLRIAGRARRKIHQHRLQRFGVSAGKFIRHVFQLGIEINPTGAGAHCGKTGGQSMVFLAGAFYMLCDVARGGGNDGGNAGGFKPVDISPFSSAGWWRGWRPRRFYAAPGWRTRTGNDA